MFQAKYGSRLGQQPALRLLTSLGAKLWRDQLQSAAIAEMVAETDNDDNNVDRKSVESDREHVWTPESVVHAIEKMVLHSAHLIRRARWFCLLSESSLTWSPADHRDNVRTLVFENGSVLKRKNLWTGGEVPMPPGCTKSFRERQKNIDLTTYDRLRVVTTELRRLVSEGRNIELRLNPKFKLNRRDVISALRWV